MLIHDHPLLAIERPFLEQDVVANADLPDVVQQAGPFDLLGELFGQPHHPGHGAGDAADASGMVAGVSVAGVHCGSEGEDGLLEHLARLDVAVVRDPRREERDHEQRSRPPAHPVRQLEDLRHEPGEGRETDEADGHAAEILHPNGAHGRAGSHAHRRDGEGPVDEVEDGARNKQPKELNYPKPAWSRRKDPRRNRLINQRTQNRRSRQGRMVEEGSVPGNLTSYLARIGCTNDGHHGRCQRTAKEECCEKRSG